MIDNARPGSSGGDAFRMTFTGGFGKTNQNWLKNSSQSLRTNDSMSTRASLSSAR